MFCPKCGNQLEQNVKFCSRCGTSLINDIPINNNQFNNGSEVVNNFQPTFIKPRKNYKWLAISGILIAVIILVIAIVTLLGDRKGHYYFDENSYDNDIEVSNNGSHKRSQYSTVIITDTTYEGVSISGKDDAYQLISKDSTKQKLNCPLPIVSVENDIIKDFGITAVNLCEMDYGFAQEIYNVLKKIYTEYPSIRGYITNLSLINAPSSMNGVIAYFEPYFFFATSDDYSLQIYKTQVMLNTSWFLNPERIDAGVKSSSAAGHFPKNATRYSPVAHEFGHYISFIAMIKHHNLNSVLLYNGIDEVYKATVNDFGYGKYSLEMIEEAYNNYKKDYEEAPSFDEWRRTISEYAVAKDKQGNYIYDETIAEAFHDVYLNGDKAAIASKYVIDVLKSKLEG